MGNKQYKQQSQQHEPSSSKSSSEPSPFDGIPQLIGPDEAGWYYHKDDQEKTDKDGQHHIHFKFKYTFDLVNNGNIGNDEKKNNECRYEWSYTAPYNPTPHIIKDNTYYDKQQQQMVALPQKYERIRAYLAKNDPIPPYFLRTSKMAGLVFQNASKNSLCKVKKLKCRIATNCIGKMVGSLIKMEHPALLIWRRDDIFCEYDDKPVTMIHLTTLPVGYRNIQEQKEKIDRIEIQCRTINKTQLNAGKWDYESYKEQLLDLENGLLDIAHWCLKYEIDNNYKYDLYTNNSRHFMMELCNAFKVEYDATNWTDTVLAVTKTDKKSSFLSLS